MAREAAVGANMYHPEGWDKELVSDPKTIAAGALPPGVRGPGPASARSPSYVRATISSGVEAWPSCQTFARQFRRRSVNVVTKTPEGAAHGYIAGQYRLRSFSFSCRTDCSMVSIRGVRWSALTPCLEASVPVLVRADFRSPVKQLTISLIGCTFSARLPVEAAPMTAVFGKNLSHPAFTRRERNG